MQNKFVDIRRRLIVTIRVKIKSEKHETLSTKPTHIIEIQFENKEYCIVCKY